jgi:hypothetical protein
MLWHDRGFNVLVAGISDDKTHIVIPCKFEACNNVFGAADGNGIDSI